MFDLISDAYVESATAIYSSRDKILELSNVEKDRGYALKKEGNEMYKFVVSTTLFDEKYEREIFVDDASTTNVSIDVPLKFMSTLLVRGTVCKLQK